VSCIETFKPTCESHIPVNPPDKKNKIKANANNKAASHFSAPLIKLNVQLTIFTVAGNDIITVIVLYNARLR